MKRILVILLALSAQLVHAEHPFVAAHEQLLEYQVLSETTQIPSDGLVIATEAATFLLDSGTIELVPPIADGILTGLVFTGRGTVEIPIPDQRERHQLARMTGNDPLAQGESLSLAIESMVLRSSDDLYSGLPLPGNLASSALSQLRKDREDTWLENGFLDLNARILASVASPGRPFMLASMKTANFGWLALIYDGMAQEEISLVKLHDGADFDEVWMSFDRVADRLPDGQPGALQALPMDFETVEIDVAIEGSGACVGRERNGHRQWFDLSTRTTIHTEPGLGALVLELGPYFKVSQVLIAGSPVDFIRTPIGPRRTNMENEVQAFELVVLLPARSAEETIEMVVEGELKIGTYASGRSWYPGQPEGLFDRHAGTIRITHPKSVDLASHSEAVVETLEGKLRRSTFKTVKPTAMLSFTCGRGLRQEVVELDGIPKVTAIGSTFGASTGNLVKNVAIDVAKSLAFYEWLYSTEIPDAPIHAARIDGYHGQAFEGLLHLSRLTFDQEISGSAELFRAHEAAHIFWGHTVGWASYRDQWLSEAFAEYSALLYLEAIAPEQKWFNEVLNVYTNELTGSAKGAGSRFTRGATRREARHSSDKIGPISVGYRASTLETPGAYFSQAYQKGALVLHMVRSLLHTMSGNDDLFRQVLGGFLETHKGGVATTADFRLALEEATGADWGFFFKQWIEGTAIPTYKWSWKSEKSADGWVLVLTVEQSDVPEGFQMPIPVAIELGGDRIAKATVMVSKPSETFRINLSSDPVKVTFNPDHAVLAKTNKK